MENIIKELVKAYREYICLLEEDIAGNAAYLAIHGIRASSEKIEKGRILRERIKALENIK